MMKILLRAPFLALAVPGLLALPVTTPPTPTPHPVAPSVRSVAVPPGDGLLEVVQTAADDTTRFSLVGVSWAGAADLPVGASLRVRRDGVWGGWEPVPASEPTSEGVGSDGQAPRGATDPVWVGESDGVQVRVDPPDGARPADLRVDLIDPGTSPADAHLAPASPASTATASDGRPAIITRAQWGADESLRTSTCSVNVRPRAGAVHHTASTNDYSAAGAAAQMRGIYAYHVKSLGWCDVGYQYLVDKFGRIYEGRAGIDEEVLGAHAGGFNSATFGVSAIGDYTKVAPPAAMIDAIGTVMGWKLGRYGVNPQGSTALTSSGGGTAKFPAGQSVTVPAVFPHRQVGSTACPGAIVDHMARIRAVAASVASRTPVKPPSAEVKKVVAAMYADLLGRSADQAGLDYWSGLISRGQLGAEDVAYDLARSPEWTGKVVSDLYGEVFGRRPDGQGLATWTGQLRGDPSKVVQVAASLYSSQEHYNAHGNGQDLSAWVRSLYVQVLGREPDAVGQAQWVAAAASRGRAYVAESIYQSQEKRQQRVGGLYRHLLQRGVDPSGMGTWTPVLLTRGDIALASSLAGSEEYRQRAQRR